MHKHDEDLGAALKELQAAVRVNRVDIDALQAQSRESIDRADASEARANEAEASAAQHRARSDSDRVRMDGLEQQASVDRQIIAELQTDGLLKAEKVEQLEAALATSRRIGAAIGIIMARCRVTDEQAFSMLRSRSQHTNKKLRVLADEIAETGDVSELEHPPSDPE